MIAKLKWFLSDTPECGELNRICKQMKAWIYDNEDSEKRDAECKTLNRITEGNFITPITIADLIDVIKNRRVRVHQRMAEFQLAKLNIDMLEQEAGILSEWASFVDKLHSRMLDYENKNEEMFFDGHSLFKTNEQVYAEEMGVVA